MPFSEPFDGLKSLIKTAASILPYPVSVVAGLVSVQTDDNSEIMVCEIVQDIVIEKNAIGCDGIVYLTVPVNLAAVIYRLFEQAIINQGFTTLKEIFALRKGFLLRIVR